jgi:hypothetical protein
LAKDLIIGGASNYKWEDVRNWVKSIKATGFEGDIALVATNLDKATIERLDKENVQLYLYGTMTEDGGIEAPKNGIEPHVERFFYIWYYLRNIEEDYRFVVATDVRDVVFQRNPIEFLEASKLHSYVCASEGLTYENEPWGAANFSNTFGPFFFEQYKDKMIYNVGVLGGYGSAMKDLMMMIFQMCANRPLRVCDQAAWNFLLNLEPYSNETRRCIHLDAFSVNLGTTEEAIKAGKGDIGHQYMNDPTILEKYKKDYMDHQPVVDADGLVMNHKGEEFYVVHQYDRIPGLKEKIDGKYST